MFSLFQNNSRKYNPNKYIQSKSIFALYHYLLENGNLMPQFDMIQSVFFCEIVTGVCNVVMFRMYP